MGRGRGADDLSEVVRQRLQALLAEIPARRVADGEGIAGPGRIESSVEPVVSGEPRINHAPAPAHPAVADLAGQGLARNSIDQYFPGELSAGGDPRADASIDAGRRSAEGGPKRRSRDDAAAAVSPEPEPQVTAPSSGQLLRLAPRLGQFVREHLIVVGVVVLTGVLWGGYSLLQARTTPVAVAAQPSVAVSGGPASATPTSTARLLVHVLGEVRRPGVVTLAEGARVRDALVAAGGLTSRAKPGDLNLAAPVVDGSQLVIGRRGSRISGTGAGASGTAAGPGKIDLNSASAEQLDALPGVGPVTAQKILAWRAAHGRFRSVTELQEVDGIGPKSYAEIAPLVRV